MKMITPYWTTHSFASDLIGEMDRFFGDGNRATPAEGVYDERTFNPACEISELDGHYLMSVDLPGMRKENIKIEMSDNILTISGERKRESTEKNEKVQRYEKSYGFFKRSFTLPNSIEPENVEARYEDGVLELYLPKTQAAKPRYIEVQSGKSGFFDKFLSSKKSNQELKDVTSTKVF
ncbi:MAG: Hsp20/alpha crystallin family protein [Pseudobdellovibrionaceae bacterium]